MSIKCACGMTLLAISCVATIPSVVYAGIVGVDRSDPDIGDWALDLLEQNYTQFAECSRLYKSGQLDECRALLSQLRESNATLPQPDLVIVWMLLSERKLIAAKTRLEALAALVPRDPEVSLTVGQVAIAELRCADAAAQFERAALLQLPEVWSEKQRSEYAFKVFHNLAATYERQSRWSDIKPALATLMRLAPNDPSYLIRLALAHFQLSETNEAKLLLEKAARMTGGATPAELLMADVAFSSQRFADAQKAIDEARRKHADNFNVQLWHAEWMLLQGECDQAQESLAKASRLGSSSSRYWVPSGQLNLMRGNFSGAVSDLRRALSELDKESDERRRLAIENLLALALTCSNQETENTEGIALAEKNALENSTDPNLIATLGWAYLKQGKLDEAKQLLNRAVEMSPQLTPDLNFFLAQLHHAAHEPEQAKRCLQAATNAKQSIFLLKACATQLAETLEVPK